MSEFVGISICGECGGDDFVLGLMGEAKRPNFLGEIVPSQGHFVIPVPKYRLRAAFLGPSFAFREDNRGDCAVKGVCDPGELLD